MSIRNVVKVMNFHSLIRVDKAKRQADKYLMMEDQLYAMMEAIVNNRNLILDKKIFRVNEDAPKINIYIGSDFGFCSNYNSQVNDQLHKDPAGVQSENQVLIAVWVSSCERLSMTTDQISVSEFMVAIGSQYRRIPSWHIFHLHRRVRSDI